MLQLVFSQLMGVHLAQSKADCSGSLALAQVVRDSGDSLVNQHPRPIVRLVLDVLMLNFVIEQHDGLGVAAPHPIIEVESRSQ